MFTRIEVQNYRSLKNIDLPLSEFHVLTGANATGKTTLLDLFAFLSPACGLIPELRFQGWQHFCRVPAL